MNLKKTNLKTLPTLLPLGIAVMCFAADATVKADTPQHYQAASMLIDQITFCQSQGVFVDGNGVALNRYGGSWNSNSNPSFIRFADPENGILPGNNTKCSPLVTHLFKTLYNWNWSNYSFYDPILGINKSTASPQAYQYCLLIKQGLGLSQVMTLDEALPGDVLSWWQVGSSSSDHTMIIESVNWGSAKPYPLGYANSNPALAGTTYFEVTVIDSSSDTHTSDSRFVNVNGNLEHIAGIGRGVIGLLVNSNFGIVGRTWSLPTSDYYTKTNTWVGSLNNRLKLAPTWEIVIGRMPENP
ncbi:MAG: hypothetical protein KDM64_01650 [Verrucomicrobiae bacterium]|nr:hypothetical protein [Verrucomicrobiae bacterium]